jgi:ribosome biogenesis GTPase
VTGRLRHEAASRRELPAVGDWVAVAPRAVEGRATIHAVLPRRSSFERKAAGRETEAQVVAANVDVVFLVAALDDVPNLRRLERYLTLAWESGALPVVVLTKADRADDVPARVAEVSAVALGADVLVVSSPRGEGLEAVHGRLRGARTGALLGASGAGKSTLVNALVGAERLRTQAVREDGKGRHTTTHRELVLLPDDGVLIDTPGMRELQLWGADDGLEASFADVAELAAGCRFRDCTHATEPDCAVLAAVDAGLLPAERLESFRKLQRELRSLAVRQDALLTIEERKKVKAIERSLRKYF